MRLDRFQRGVIALSFVTCSGSPLKVEIGPPPPRMTRAVLAGPLCEGGRCSCRNLDASDDGGAGVPDDATRKRFEIRLTSPNELWATIGSARLYKDAEHAEACFYLDLPSGGSPVELRASNRDGAAGQWAIRELGTQTKSYYDTFRFGCGVPGACTFEALAEARKEYSGATDNIHDPCGSTKIKRLSWAHSKTPDGVQPTDISVTLNLEVYRFAPSKSHGDPTCSKPAQPGNGSPGG